MSTITLPKDLADWARAEVAAGRGESVEVVVVEALRGARAIWDAHRPLVMEAYAQVAAGEALSFEEVEAELDRWIAEDEAAERDAARRAAE